MLESYFKRLDFNKNRRQKLRENYLKQTPKKKKKKDVVMVESFGQCPNLRKTAPKLFHAPLQRFRNMMKMFGSK